MALVIKKWSASSTKDANGNYVHIIGREAGLIAWLLSLIKIDPVTSLEITDKVVMFAQGSLEGSEKRVIPLGSVCSSYYGYKKPWKEALVIGLVLLPLFGVGLIVGPLYYFLNKTLTIGLIENSGWVGGLSFKRSVIEGQNISEAQAHQVIDIVRTLVEQRVP